MYVVITIYTNIDIDNCIILYYKSAGRNSAAFADIRFDYSDSDVYIINPDYSQFFRIDNEFETTPIRYFFKCRCYAAANPDLPDTRSTRTLHYTHCGGNYDWRRIEFWHGRDNQCNRF